MRLDMAIYKYDSFTCQQTENYYLLADDLLFYNAQAEWKHVGNVSEGPIKVAKGILSVKDSCIIHTVNGKAKRIGIL